MGKCAKSFNVKKGMGMINNIFNDESIRRLKGNLGIGHTRYSTSAASEEVNCQPFVVHTAHGAMAVAHNGQLVNCESLRRNVIKISFSILPIILTKTAGITGITGRRWSVDTQ